MNKTEQLMKATQVKYNSQSAIAGELQIQISGDYIGKRMETMFAELKNTASLKGFRKGKVPENLLRQKFRHQVIRDTFETLVGESCRGAASQEKLPVVGEPRVLRTNWLTWKEGEQMEFTARVELIPTVEAKKYKGLSFEMDDFTVNDKSVDDALKQFLEPRSELKEVEAKRGVREGDFVVINFKGFLGDEPVKDAGAENFLLEIGGPNTMRDFQDGVLGMKVDETRDVNVTYPADYANAEIAGKPMRYEVKLLEIKTKVYPEINDELAKEFQAESVEDLHKKVRDNIEYRSREEEKNQKEERLLEALVAANPFEVPITLIQYQLNQLIREVSRVLERQKYSAKLIEEYLGRHIEELQERAQREVKLALLLPKVVEAEKIEPTEAEVDERIKWMAEASGRPVEEYQKTFSSGEARANLKSQVARDMAIDRMAKAAKITIKKGK